MAEYYDPLEFEDLGDKLFRKRGSMDIVCEYPLVSFERIDGETSGKAIYEYGPYIITVTYDIDGGKRKNAHWTRVYKEAGG